MRQLSFFINTVRYQNTEKSEEIIFADFKNFMRMLDQPFL
jgi:hypothetical protein